ncbi:MAG TPA: lysylphosphatidylglycerol synthase transmembrane domain-containing protein [Gemmatimonadales bacterium]|nr:lysylphosphatidylglycerol synthase transmembrane domain-containing protein [Gemmatimonadales bacterium]
MPERRWWWRGVQIIGAIVLVALAVRSLSRNWNDLQSQSIEWRINPLWIALSLVITWAAYAGLIEAWRRVVVSLRQRLGYGDAARITMVSNLGKYVPGKVWAIAGAAYLAQQVGVTKTAAVASAVVLQALALASGVILVAVLAPGLNGVPAGYVIGGAALGVAAVGGTGVLCSPRALDVIQRRLPASIPRLEPIAPGVMLAALCVNAAAWCAYGLAFVALTRGVLPEASLSWTLATSVFTTSYLIGLLVAFAPGGLGVRESMFVLLLGGPLGVKLAGALALATRVTLTIAELGAAVPFLLIRTSRGVSR